MNNHKFDNTKRGGRNGNGNNNTKNNRKQQERNESNDNVSTITEASFQQGNFGEGKCFCCGKKVIIVINVDTRINLRVNGHLKKQNKILQHQMMNNLLIKIVMMTGVYHQNGVDYTLVKIIVS